MALNEFSNQTHTSPKILNGDTFCSSQESSGPNRLENDKLEPIAVVGMSLKFPQSATSPDSFWQMLLDGRSAMTEIPKDRLNIDAFYHADANRSGSVSHHHHYRRLPDDLNSFLFVEVISLRKILPCLMPLFFPYPLQRLHVWILNKDFYWKRHIRRWKTVRLDSKLVLMFN